MSDDIVKSLLESLTDEQKSQLVQGLMSNMNQTVSKSPSKETQAEQEESVSSKSDFRVAKTKSQIERGKVPVRAKKNLWSDDGEIQLGENQKEWSSDRKKSDRNRSKAKKVELECSVCGRTFMENPSLVYGENHRCNRCGRR